MITKLQNNNLETAKNIRAVFQVSYKVEAELLKAVNFPPLQRPLENFMNSITEFYGYTKEDQLAGVVEVIHNQSYTHVRSLVVDPKFFRQGIGKKLMEFVLNIYNSNLYIVETGVDNNPAIQLYKKLEFIEVKQWDTDHGVRKIKLERRG